MLEIVDGTKRPSRWRTLKARPMHRYLSAVDLIRRPRLRLLRSLGKSVARRWPYPVPVRVAKDVQLFVDLRSAVGRGVFVKNDFDPVVRACIERLLDPGDIFVDVGANVGFYSVRAALHVGSEGEVHAFEVDPRALRCLRRTQLVNRLPQMIIHPVALGCAPGLVSLSTTDEMGHTRATHGERASVRYPVLPLDVWSSYFQGRPAKLIKIDVEGAELYVLNGAANILDQHRPYVLCEASADNLAAFGHALDDLFEFMRGRGYDITELPSNGGDVLFSPRERPLICDREMSFSCVGTRAHVESGSQEQPLAPGARHAGSGTRESREIDATV